MLTALTENQIDAFVRAWFQALDQHVPREEAALFLADSGLEMIFPERTVRSLEDFAAWYWGGHYSDGEEAPGVTNIFFDEEHNVASVESNIHGDQADLDVVAAWTTLWIDPPKPRAKRVSLDSTHRWTVKASTRNPYGLVIVSYKVDLQYAPGSARFPAQTPPRR